MGYGSIGKRHVENLRKITNHEILVCTKNKQANILKKSGIKVFQNIEKCLKENPDVGIICNETSYHVDTAIKLAKNHCHIFIEKPLSNSLKNLTSLSNLVKKNNLVTMIGCDMRFHKCILKIYDIISSGKLGKIISVQSQNGSYLPSWHPYEDYRKSYASRKNLGGGVVLTLIHEIDYLSWFFGYPSGVLAHVEKLSDLKISTEDFAAIILKFDKKIVAEVHLDYFQKIESRYCKIIGTKGMVYWNSTSNSIIYFNNLTNKRSTIFKYKNFKRNNQFVDELNYFLDCVKNHHPSFNNLDDGIKTLKIALAIKKSSKLEKLISIK